MLQPRTQRALQTARLFLAITLAYAVAGCASSTAKDPAATTTPGNSTGNFAASTFMLTNFTGSPASVASTLASSGARVAVFQWSGVTCTTCQALSKSFEASMGQQITQRQVAHFIVFDDAQTDYQATSYTSFLGVNASMAQEIHDFAGIQKKNLKLQAGRNLYDAVRPTLILDKQSHGTVVWTESGAELTQGVTAALQTAAP